MKKILLSLTVAFLSILSACSKADDTEPANTILPKLINGIPLWDTVLSGMTPEEVLESVKNSKWFVHLNPSQKGSQVLVRLDNYEWLDEIFTVSFLFQSCHLTTVSLTSQNGPKNFNLALKKSKKYIKELTTNFGKPIKQELSDETDNFKLYNTSWEKKGIRIGLAFLEVFDSPAEITIGFSPTDLGKRAGAPNNKSCWPPQTVIDKLYPPKKEKIYAPGEIKDPGPPDMQLLPPPPPPE